MIRPRSWQPDVILAPRPTRFNSPQLRAAIAAPIAAEWRCLAGNRHPREQETCDCERGEGER